VAVQGAVRSRTARAKHFPAGSAKHFPAGSATEHATDAFQHFRENLPESVAKSTTVWWGEIRAEKVGRLINNSSKSGSNNLADLDLRYDLSAILILATASTGFLDRHSLMSKIFLAIEV
jgi:hypothetical protein